MRFTFKEYKFNVYLQQCEVRAVSHLAPNTQHGLTISQWASGGPSTHLQRPTPYALLKQPDILQQSENANALTLYT